VVRTIINGMTFDGATKDPIQKAVRDALIAFMAATAQAQVEATKEAQKAGIKMARKGEGQRPSTGAASRPLMRSSCSARMSFWRSTWPRQSLPATWVSPVPPSTESRKTQPKWPPFWRCGVEPDQRAERRPATQLNSLSCGERVSGMLRWTPGHVGP
jgi:hypothetical protein